VRLSPGFRTFDGLIICYGSLFTEDLGSGLIRLDRYHLFLGELLELGAFEKCVMG
jgi:hypothetical protein